VGLLWCWLASVPGSASASENGYPAADKELNRIYGDLESRMPPLDKDWLREDQLSWLQWRDKETNQTQPDSRRLEQLEDMTKERIILLKQMLQDIVRAEDAASKMQGKTRATAAEWKMLPYWYKGKWHPFAQIIPDDKWRNSAGSTTNPWLTSQQPFPPPSKALKFTLATNLINESAEFQRGATRSPSGRLLAVQSDWTYYVLDLQTRQCVWTFNDPLQPSFFWTKDDDLILHYGNQTSQLGYIRKYDVHTRTVADFGHYVVSHARYSQSLNKAFFSTMGAEVDIIIDFQTGIKKEIPSADSGFGAYIQADRFIYGMHTISNTNVKDGSSSRSPTQRLQSLLIIDLKDESSHQVGVLKGLASSSTDAGILYVAEDGSLILYNPEKKQQRILHRHTQYPVAFGPSDDGADWWAVYADKSVLLGDLKDEDSSTVLSGTLDDIRTPSPTSQSLDANSVLSSIVKIINGTLYYKNTAGTVCGWGRDSLQPAPVDTAALRSLTANDVFDGAPMPDGVESYDELCRLDHDNIVVNVTSRLFNPTANKEVSNYRFAIYNRTSRTLVDFFPHKTNTSANLREQYDRSRDGRRAPGWVFHAGQKGEKLYWKDQVFDFSSLTLQNFVIPLKGKEFLPDKAIASIPNPTWESYLQEGRKREASMDGSSTDYSSPALCDGFTLLLGPQRRPALLKAYNVAPPWDAPIWLSPSGRLAAVREGWRGWTTFLIDTNSIKYMVQHGNAPGSLNLADQEERKSALWLYKPLDDTAERVAVVTDTYVYIVDYKHGKILSKEWCPGVDNAVTSTDGSHIYASITDGSVRCFTYDKNGILQPLYQLTADAAGNWVIYTADGYYMTRGGENLISISTYGKAEAFSTDQFSLRFNRPDIILSRLGAPTEAVAMALEMRRKYLQRMGLTEEMLNLDLHLPVVSIVGEVNLTTSREQIIIPIKASDTLYDLERLRVFVNNVPVNGRDGQSLRQRASKELSFDLPVALIAGRNKIQISVVNSVGTESLYASREVLCTAKTEDPVLHTVALGVSQYKQAAHNLRYAAKDAQDITACLQTSPLRTYAKVRSLCLTDAEVTLEALPRIREFLSTAGINDTVIFFVAGHGVLDAQFDYYFAAADIDFANPSGRGIPFDDLEQIMAEIPCLRKSVWVDTCHAGELDAEEKVLLAANVTGASTPTAGGSRVSFRSVSKRGMRVRGIQESELRNEWHQRLQGLLVDLRRGSGTTLLSSSAASEFALESSEQRNGLFTFALIEALQGKSSADSNKDGSVTLSELTEYARERVSALSNGQQNPNKRRINLEMDFVLCRAK
jgi:hypothetical protein